MQHFIDCLMCDCIFARFCTLLHNFKIFKVKNICKFCLNAKHADAHICLNFGKFAQVLLMFVWPKFQMCSVHVRGLKIWRNSQFVNFQLETQINWRIMCTWKCNYYRHNNWNQNNCSNNRSWNKKIEFYLDTICSQL